MTTPDTETTLPEVPDFLAHLSPRELAFVHLAYKSGSLEKAYVDAGYSPKGADANCRRKAESLREVMAQYADHVSNEAMVSNARIIEEHALIAFHNPADFFDTLKDLDGEVLRDGAGEIIFVTKDITQLGDLSRCISEIEKTINTRTKETRYKIKFYSKQHSLDTLAKIKGMFKDGGGELPRLLLNFLQPEGGRQEVEVSTPVTLPLPHPGSTASGAGYTPPRTLA